MVCRGLGIIKDGEDVTERAMDEFGTRFQGQVPEAVMVQFRALFQVGSPGEDDELEDALLAHGGAAGLDLDAAGEGDNTADV